MTIQDTLPTPNTHANAHDTLAPQLRERIAALEGQLAAWQDNEANMRRELEAVKAAALNLLGVLPIFEIEIAREAWGNTNTRLVLEYRDKLQAALRPDPQPSEATPVLDEELEAAVLPSIAYIDVDEAERRAKVTK